MLSCRDDIHAGLGLGLFKVVNNVQRANQPFRIDTWAIWIDGTGPEHASYFCPYIPLLVIATHFPSENLPNSIASDLEKNGYRGIPTSFGHKAGTYIYPSKVFHSLTPVLVEKWVYIQFNPSRVLSRTFPLEVIGKTSPTLEMGNWKDVSLVPP